MLDLSWTELLIIGVVALIAIGPKELPGVLRAMGSWMGKIRRMAGEFQSQFNEAMREAEMADIKKQVDEMTGAASSITNYDPLGEITKQFDTALDDKPETEKTADNKAAEEPAVATAPPAPETPATAPASQDNAEAASAPASAAETAAAQPKAGGGA